MILIRVFAPVNWTAEYNGGIGTIDLTNVPTDITMMGSTGMTVVDYDTDYCITIPSDGNLSFDWAASMDNGAGGSGGQLLFDEPQTVVNMVATNLPLIVTGVNSDMGTYTGSFSEGDEFCFRVKSNDNGYWTVLDISNFSFEITQIAQTSGVARMSVQPVGVYPIVYTYEDCDGTPVTCTFDVTVADNEPPMVTCPGDVTGLTCMSMFPLAATTVAEFIAIDGTSMASDNCDITSITSSDDIAHASIDFCVGGVITRTYTFMDAAGGTSMCSHTFTFDPDITNPVAINPGNISGNQGLTCGDSFDPNDLETNFGEGFPMATDNCSVGITELGLTW